MRFPLSWIAEYADLPADESAAAEAFTLSGSEVEGRDAVDGETVLELGITVNRPDCMNVYGLAREASVLFGTALRKPDTTCAESGPAVETLTSVAVEAPDLCPRYAARVITGARVGVSPPWMQKRLEQCGLRPINAVVDVTNYVLLELGHPLHAFDMARLAERRIVVRRARSGEKLVTLDGVERALAPDRLVIADASRPVALAGVMGGEETGVTFATADVLLEGAVFDPVNIRRTSKATGLHTDASHRFERGVDFEGPVPALDRAARLILEICGGSLATGRIDVACPRPARPPVRLRHGRLVSLVGMDIPGPRCESILEALGFGVEPAGEGAWEVSVPSFRVDVSREADLIEEVVRVHGLKDLGEPLPSVVDPVGGRPAALVLEESLRDAMAAAGFNEAVHMTMTSPEIEAAFGAGAPVLALANPLSPHASVLRTNLLGPLVGAVARNRARGVRRLALFECGMVHRSGAPEARHLAAALYDDGQAPRWGEPPAPGFLHLKGRIEAALLRAGLACSFEPADAGPFAAGLCLRILAGGRAAGFLGAVAPSAMEAAGLKSGRLFAAEISIQGLESAVRGPAFRALSRFPSVVRDFSFLMDRAVAWGDVAARLEALALPDLSAVRLVDIYEGEGLPEGRKSVTFSLAFQAMDRTLTDDDIAPVANRVSDALQEAFAAILR